MRVRLSCAASVGGVKVASKSSPHSLALDLAAKNGRRRERDGPYVAGLQDRPRDGRRQGENAEGASPMLDAKRLSALFARTEPNDQGYDVSTVEMEWSLEEFKTLFCQGGNSRVK